MNQNKEGVLTLKDVDAERLRFTISFAECAECAGITASRCFCYYHAGTFAGIIASLMNKEMDAYESECTGTGHQACVFILGKRDDPEISVRVADFLAQQKLSVAKNKDTQITQDSKLRQSLGNLVNIEYYQLILTNSILSNPSLFSASSFNVGEEYGGRLSSIFKNVNHDNLMDGIKDYYRQLLYLNMEITEIGADKIITLNECAEITPTLQKKELLGFLLGELQGLFSGLTGTPLVCKDSRFEGSTLKVKLSPKV